MSRYIDADAFVADSKWCGLETAEQVLFALDHQPSIDIVKCKECRHWYRALDESGTIERFNFSKCTKGHSGNGLEFYCADGEREDE